MINFPVNPDEAAISQVVYNETAVFALTGKNFTQDMLIPADMSIQSREFVYIRPTNCDITDWNDEATNGFQTALWVDGYQAFYNYYTNILIPLKIRMCVIFHWEIEYVLSGSKIHPGVKFKYLPLSE